MGNRPSLAGAAALSVAGALTLSAVAGAAPPRTTAVFTASLNGAAEVPGPGDPDGRGIAVLRIDLDDDDSICFWLLVRRIAPASTAHIHEGGRNVAGPAVQGVEPPTDGYSSGCVDNPVLAEEILDNPSNYYINVHNTPYPLGAVRGQLT